MPTNILPFLTPHAKIRTLSKVRTGPKCWEWQGSLDKGGYGQVRINGKLLSAHRVVWVLVNGEEIPDLEGSDFRGTVLMHTCDNPKCCNPRHLIPSTQSSNMADCAAKGRNPRPNFFGSARAKVTPAEVLEIRRLYAVGDVTQSALGARFGLSQSRVSCIIRGAAWRQLSAS